MNNKYEFRMNGSKSAVFSSNSLDEASAMVAVLMGTSISGDIVDSETGEVLMTMTNGAITYISTDTVISFLRDVCEHEPVQGKCLICSGLAAFQNGEDAISQQTFAALNKLHEELYGAVSPLDIKMGELSLLLGIL